MMTTAEQAHMNTITKPATASGIWAAREILRTQGFHTSVSNGDLLVTVNRLSARLAMSICAGRNLEYTGLEKAKCLRGSEVSVARWRAA